MSDLQSYEACSIKRSRRTKAEMEAVKGAIVTIVEADHPMTVRQVFYRLVVAGLIEKTEVEYQGVVVRLLTDMRLNGEIEWAWIVDESRRRRTTRTYSGLQDAINQTAKLYRRSGSHSISLAVP